MSSEVLNRIDEYVKRDFPFTTSALIVRNGWIVFEKHYQGGKDELRPQYSITKSLMSALTGIAIGQGSIESVEVDAYRHLPDWIRSAMKTDARGITVRQLLPHTSGLGDNGGTGDVDAASLNTCFRWGLNHPPGTVFALSGNNAHLLSVMITQTSGRRASAFARQHLFDRIGVKQAVWEEGSQWTAGYSGASLTTRDMPRLGCLYLRQGRWNTEQVIPENWIAESTRKQMSIPVY